MIDGWDGSILTILKQRRWTKKAAQELISKLSPAGKKIAAKLPIRYLSKAVSKRIDKIFYILTGHV